MSRAPHDWRPPKKGDDRAWARVAAGQWLTERLGHREQVRVGLPRLSATFELPYAVRAVRESWFGRVPTDSRSQLHRLLDAIDIGREEEPVDEVQIAKLRESLRAFVTHGDARVRHELASSPEAPPEALAVLMKDVDVSVRLAALANPSAAVTARVLHSAACSEHADVRLFAAQDKRTAKDDLARLLRDRVGAVVVAAAANSSTRLTDLWDVPVHRVPPARLQALIASQGARSVRTSGAALEMLSALSGDESLTVRDALGAASDVLA